MTVKNKEVTLSNDGPWTVTNNFKDAVAFTFEFKKALPLNRVKIDVVHSLIDKPADETEEAWKTKVENFKQRNVSIHFNLRCNNPFMAESTGNGD